MNLQMLELGLSKLILNLVHANLLKSFQIYVPYGSRSLALPEGMEILFNRSHLLLLEKVQTLV